VYLASVPTMDRILGSVDEVRERRRQAVHPAYLKPELMAEWPNQVWSWDITYLYVVLDIFSRYVVGWMLAMRESASLAERLLADSIHKQGVERDQLTIHVDRGSSMSSKPVALLLFDLGVTKSHSPAPPLERQPLLGGPVRDPQGPARVPRRSARPGRQGLQQALLRLV